MNLTVVNHPLVQHKLGLLREGDISTNKFRTITHELARLLAYEATRDFELEPITIDGWCGKIEVQQIKGKKVTVVPILRAGNSGAVYFAVNGRTYGPAAPGVKVVKNVELSPNALTSKFAFADLTKDPQLAEMVALASVAPTETGEAARPE